MSAPTIPTLPPAPLPSDSKVQFNAKAYPFVAALNPFGQQINAFGQYLTPTGAATLPLAGTETVTIDQGGERKTLEVSALGITEEDATLPLAGTETVVVLQGGEYRNAPVSAIGSGGGGGGGDTNLIQPGVFTVPEGNPSVVQRGNTLEITSYMTLLDILDPVAAGFVTNGLYSVDLVLRDTGAASTWNVALRVEVQDSEGDVIGTCDYDAGTSGNASTVPGYTFSGIFGLPTGVSLAGKSIRLIFFNNYGAVGVTLLNITPRGLNQVTTLTAP